MRHLFHILAANEWAAAQAQGSYAPVSLESEGFIHLSREGQVVETANRFYRGVQGLIVLVIDANAVEPDVVWEEGEPGVLFPHLYRPLRVQEVTDSLDLIDVNGQWVALREQTVRPVSL